MLEKLIKEHGGLESALESLDRKGSVKALFPTASSKKKKEEISNNKVKDESLIDDSKKDNSEDETKKQEDSLRLKLLLSAKQECA